LLIAHINVDSLFSSLYFCLIASEFLMSDSSSVTVSYDLLEQSLLTIPDPCIAGVSLFDRGAIRNIKIDGGEVSFSVVLGYPAKGIQKDLESSLERAVLAVPGVTSVVIDLSWGVVANKTQNNLQSLVNVKNIIAVASGKGGVGKSTTSVNLALALAAEGAKVGLLDADIYGPSQPLMLGLPEGARPRQRDEKTFWPMEAHGLQAMSMGFLLTDKTPVVWRGPMVSGALQQLLTQTAWRDLDYLIIDMPPGTGDIQLTLAQKVPVTGAVIVTTPQDIALLDAVKGIEMFRKVDIPVLGVVENMAVHICTECGHAEHIFGEGGAERLAKDYDAPVLGSLPLDLKIRQAADAGEPTVVAEPESEASARYRSIARQLAANLAARGRNEAMPEIIFSAD
jgi:ATP-binding protein involved in chromosome partitioning